MQIFLRAIIEGYLLFFITHFDVLIFLSNYSINAMIGRVLYKTKPSLNVKLSGIAYGYVVKRGVHRVVMEAPTLYANVYLNVTPFTKMIGLKNLNYGEQVMAYGKLKVILGEVCMVPTRIICSNDIKKIKKDMYKRLGFCIWITTILEVIVYVVSLRL